MTMLKEVIAELIAIFMGDARLTFAVLTIVAGAAALIKFAGSDPLGASGILLVCCLGLLIENVHRSARPGVKLQKECPQHRVPRGEPSSALGLNRPQR
jgi:hypothetical protein